MDIQASLSIPARIETAGSTTVAAERLREICARLPEGAEIVIDATDPLRAQIKARRSKFSIGALPSKDFPLLTEPEGGAVLEMAAGAMLRLLTIGSDCMGDLDPLNCCWLETVDGNVRAVSTSGKTLTYCDALAPGFEIKGGARLGVETIAVLLRALGAMDANDTASIRVCPGKMLGASLGGMDIVSRVIDGGEWVPYDRVIPETADGQFTVDVDSFSAMLRRAQIAAPYVDIDLSDGKMEVSARDQASGDSTAEDVESDWSGPDRRLCVKAEFMLGILAHVRTESAIIYEAGIRAVRVAETRDSDWVGAVMPARGGK